MKTTLFLIATTALVASTVAAQPSFYQLCGADINLPDAGGKQQGAADCYKATIASPGTYGGAAWNDYLGGSCWYKSTNANAKRSNAKPIEGVDAVIALNDANAPAVKWFEVTGEKDIAGYDIANQKGKVIDCMEYCASNPSCYAFTWNDFEGGTCWLKGRATTYVASPGAVSGFLGRKVTAATVAGCAMAPKKTE